MGIFSILKEKSGPANSVALAELSAPATRAKSAFFSGSTRGKHAQIEELQEDVSVLEPETPTLAVRSSAKSFTGGCKAAHGFIPQEVRGREKERDGPGPWEIQYTGINQFQQVVELYRGSISTVYRATCSITKWPIIIKAYQKSKMKEKNFLRMEREIRLMRLLKEDDSVVQLYNVFEDASFKYLVMEMCKGGDLFKAMLLRGGKMDEQWACAEMVAPLLRTLVKLHGMHILHRDIKPENIFLSSSQRFKLGDLGLAIRSDLELPFTRSGTLDYLSPEVLANPTCDLQESPTVTKGDLTQRGVRPYNEKVDCWAAGVLAYELVVGRPPFEVKDEAKTAAAIMYKNDFLLPSKHSPQWADFVHQALQKNPLQRPSAAQLLEHPWVVMHTRADLSATLPDLKTSILSPSNNALRHSLSMAPSAPSTPVPTKEFTLPKREESAGSLLDTKGVPSVKLRAGRFPLGMTATSASDGSDTSGTWSVSEFSSSSGRPSTGSPVSILARGAEAGRAAATGSRLKSSSPKHQPEVSKSSFTQLLANAPRGDAGYIDSGDVLEEHERRAGGMRIRMKHYFKRQA